MSAECALVEHRPVDEVVEAAPQLGRAFGVEPAQEVARAVGLVVRHQRRAVAGELLSDRLELVQLAARGEPDVVVLVDVRPEHAAGDHERQHGGLDDPPAAPAAPAAPASAAASNGGRGHRQRLPADPGRADRRRTRAQPNSARRDVQEQPPGAAAPRRPEPDEPGGDHDRDQHVGRRGVVRVDAEVADRPDPEQLPAAQRADQVAEVRLLVERADLRQPVDRRDEGRDRQHRQRGREPARASEQRARRVAEQEDAGGDQRRDEPHGSRHAEDADERRARRGQRQHGTRPALGRERPGQQRRDQREQQARRRAP